MRHDKRRFLLAALAGAAISMAGPACAGGYKVLYSFQGGSDGVGPEYTLINIGTTLYGVTQFGGGSTQCSYGCGTVFSLDAASGKEAVLYAFQGGSGPELPSGGLLNVGGVLYGVACCTGTADTGAVFSVNPSTGAESTVYSFNYGNNGHDAGPTGTLILYKGTIYGAAFNGEVFSLDPQTGAESVVHTFRVESNGYVPSGGLHVWNGLLIGETLLGGVDQGFGTVYAVNPQTGNEGVFHSFGYGNDGNEPMASVIDVKGTLYGTAAFSSVLGCGVAYSLNPKTRAEAIVHSFAGGADGCAVETELLRVGNRLYGTALNGGKGNCSGTAAGGCGVVYSLDLDTGEEKILHTFKGGQDGSYPSSGLLNINGTLYGTTSDGGSGHAGTVFAIAP
jgi:uncharacterized repeat protein (TIGR03803 family)